ncbi:MAG TPA: ATP synthase subunit C [Thermoanaerobaculia bacterium]|nr:ATP synthase subunit C [Thermoanaerobaculia bacterium]
MRKKLLWTIAAIVPVVAALVVVPLFAAPEAARVAAPVPPEVVRWGFVAAAIAAGLAALGAAYAVAVVGAAAMGAIAEKPETAGRALIFVGLAEGIAIYGLIIAIMILGRLG